MYHYILSFAIRDLSMYIFYDFFKAKADSQRKTICIVFALYFNNHHMSAIMYNNNIDQTLISNIIHISTCGEKARISMQLYKRRK